MIPQMFCHVCGTQVSPDAQFCTQCGTSFTATSNLASVPPPVWTAPTSVEVHASRWVGEGWELVKADIGTYVLLALIFSLLSSAVPFILQGPLTAGFHIFVIKKMLGRRADFADLFKGFDFFVPTLVASIVIALFVGAGMILCIIPGLVLLAMYHFTYLFIVDKRMDFWPAMQASHAVVKNDYVGFTLFIVLLALVYLLGLVCCIVGVFVAIPVTIAATTVAYKEIVGFDPRTLETI